MKDVNDFLPKIPNMRWGALVNRYPTNQRLQELERLLPHDKRWHTVFETPNCMIVDNIPIVKKSKESMT
ncbi:MAG: hypothetical protein QXE82_00225 [Candidatus Nitrosotenuis sp.]